MMGDISPAPQLGVEWWETSHQLRSWGWRGGRRLTSSVVGGGKVGARVPLMRRGSSGSISRHLDTDSVSAILRQTASVLNDVLYFFDVYLFVPKIQKSY